MNPDPDLKRCPNCSTELRGPYCSVCGQHQVDLDRPLGEILTEGLSSFIAFDTRIGRTVWPLVRRPGFLTQEFLAGRRARYVHPFKLYFAFSLIFFLVFSFSDYTIIHANEPGIITIQTPDDPAVEDPAEARVGGTQDSSSADPDEIPGRISALFATLDELAAKDPAAFDRLFIDRLSKSLIVLVPIVAVLLQLIYWKPRYVAHLVFSLHVHSFSFMVLVAGALVDGAVGMVSSSGTTAGNSVATVAILVYAFLAMRRVYGQGWLLTLAKSVVLMIGYAMALVLTMLGTLVATVALL